MTAPARFSPAFLDDLRDRVPVSEMVARRVALRKAGRELVGLSPFNAERTPSFFVNDTKRAWFDFSSGRNGTIFDFLMAVEGYSFRDAVAHVAEAAGVPCDPAGPRDPAVEARLARDFAARRAAREAAEAREQEEERARAWAIWGRGVPIAGTAAEAYFAMRGLEAPASPALRFSDEVYWEPQEKPKPALRLHAGPCLLAAIQAPDGRFMGLHRTWIDLARPKGKAAIVAADGSPRPAKKMRGGVKGGAIRLCDFGPREGSPDDCGLVVGEGIETTLTVFQAIRRHPAFAGTAWFAWAAGDLGNLSGGGLGPSIPHPDKPGSWVPPSDPDPDAPGLMPPLWAARALGLRDGDSDPQVTAARMACWQARWCRAGCDALILPAPDGCDWNDLVRPA